MPEDDDQRTREFKEILTVVLVFLIGCIVVMATIPFIPDGGQSHPPRVNISRDGFKTDDWISVKWDGGIDSVFVENFSVSIDNETTYHEKPSAAGRVISTFYHPNYTCVDVKAWDRAVKTFRPIGYRCL